MSKSCAIVIPVYRTTLEWNEKISLKQCAEVLNKYDIIFVHPEDLDIRNYIEYIPNARSVTFKKKFFKDISSYSKMMMLPGFYRRFLSYDYILIYQLDAFVFKDELEQWLMEDYDYIGAPWIDATWIKLLKEKISFIDRIIYPVGNGGFSLRKTKTFFINSILLLPVTLCWKRKWNEDFFWSTFSKRLIPGFKIPSVSQALQFAFEERPEKCLELNNNKLPFGCHAWEKYNIEFWRPYFLECGYMFPENLNSK